LTTNEYNIAVKEFSNRLIRFVDKLLVDNSAAKDVVQETYMKLWESKLDVNNEKVKSWLFTTSYRLSLRYIEQQKKFIDDNTLYNVGYEIETGDLKQIIEESLALLSEIQKAILLLKDYEGYSYDEIGEILNLNESQVKVYLFRARKKVKDYIVDLKFVF
jgi:RNA polymerase sigma-70 factor (ECF subfamily)